MVGNVLEDWKMGWRDSSECLGAAAIANRESYWLPVTMFDRFWFSMVLGRPKVPNWCSWAKHFLINPDLEMIQKNSFQKRNKNGQNFFETVRT